MSREPRPGLAWALMAIGYSFSGFGETGQSELDRWNGALASVPQYRSPVTSYSRPLHLDALWIFRLMTWKALTLELLFLPLAMAVDATGDSGWQWLPCTSGSSRFWISRICSAGMLMLHVFTIDSRWPALARATWSRFGTNSGSSPPSARPWADGSFRLVSARAASRPDDFDSTPSPRAGKTRRTRLVGRRPGAHCARIHPQRARHPGRVSARSTHFLYCRPTARSERSSPNSSARAPRVRPAAPSLDRCQYSGGPGDQVDEDSQRLAVLEDGVHRHSVVPDDGTRQRVSHKKEAVSFDFGIRRLSCSIHLTGPYLLQTSRT